MPLVTDQFWRTMHQYYITQGSNNTTTSSQQLIISQDKHQQETQTVQMTEHSRKDASASAQS
eukprot:11123712-Ditylum_brightwellii.AAC.2